MEGSLEANWLTNLPPGVDGVCCIARCRRSVAWPCWRSLCGARRRRAADAVGLGARGPRLRAGHGHAATMRRMHRLLTPTLAHASTAAHSKPPTETPGASPRPRPCGSETPAASEDGRVPDRRWPCRPAIFGTLRGEVALPVSDGAVAWTPNLAFPGLRRGRDALAPYARRPSARRSGPSTARSSPRARRAPAPRRSAGWPRLSPEPWSASDDKRGARCASSSEASPATRRWACLGSSASSRSRWRGARAGACWPAGASSREAEPRAADAVRTHGRHASAGGRGGGAGRAPRRDRGARPSNGCGARARRHRLLRPSAAGVDLQDRDHHRGARGQAGQAHRHASRWRATP